MWSISLSRPDSITQVFDPSSRKIAPRHAVRRLKDISHIYCIVETTTTMSVVKVALGEHDAEKLDVSNIYEVHSSRIILVEPAPDHYKRLIVLEDDQKLVMIEDSGTESKATVEGSKDFSHHNLEEAIAQVDAKPWTSISICDRVITFGTTCYSLYTKFKFSQQPNEAQKDEDHHEGGESLYEDGELLEERNLPGTLFSIQIWKHTDGCQFMCKPLVDCKLIDLIGQSRFSKKT